MHSERKLTLEISDGARLPEKQSDISYKSEPFWLGAGSGVREEGEVDEQGRNGTLLTAETLLAQ